MHTRKQAVPRPGSGCPAGMCGENHGPGTVPDSRFTAMPSIVSWGLLVVGGLAAVVFVGGEFVPAYHQALEPYLSNIPVVPGYLIAAFLMWRRPHHRVAHRLMALGASPVIALALGEILSVMWLTFGPRPWYWLVAFANQVAELAGVAAGVALVAVFPDGAYQRRYERWIVIAVTAQVVALPAILLLCSSTLQYDPFMVWARPAILSPLYTSMLSGLGNAANSYYTSIFIWALAAAGILALRYRRLAYELRQQVKWPLWASICFAGSVVVGGFHQAGIIPYWLSQAVWYVTLPLFPLCVAIAMLRYRLLDIDVVIRKSLVYWGPVACHPGRVPWSGMGAWPGRAPAPADRVRDPADHRRNDRLPARAAVARGPGRPMGVWRTADRLPGPARAWRVSRNHCGHGCSGSTSGRDHPKRPRPAVGQGLDLALRRRASCASAHRLGRHRLRREGSGGSHCAA